jgi:hypothetical protein
MTQGESKHVVLKLLVLDLYPEDDSVRVETCLPKIVSLGSVS